MVSSSSIFFATFGAFGSAWVDWGGSLRVGCAHKKLTILREQSIVLRIRLMPISFFISLPTVGKIRSRGLDLFRALNLRCFLRSRP